MQFLRIQSPECLSKGDLKRPELNTVQYQECLSYAVNFYDLMHSTTFFLLHCIRKHNIASDSHSGSSIIVNKGLSSCQWYSVLVLSIGLSVSSQSPVEEKCRRVIDRMIKNHNIKRNK